MQLIVHIKCVIIVFESKCSFHLGEVLVNKNQKKFVIVDNLVSAIQCLSKVPSIEIAIFKDVIDLTTSHYRLVFRVKELNQINASTLINPRSEARYILTPDKKYGVSTVKCYTKLESLVHFLGQYGYRKCFIIVSK